MEAPLCHSFLLTVFPTPVCISSQALGKRILPAWSLSEPQFLQEIFTCSSMHCNVDIFSSMVLFTGCRELTCSTGVFFINIKEVFAPASGALSPPSFSLILMLTMLLLSHFSIILSLIHCCAAFCPFFNILSLRCHLSCRIR